MTAPWLDSMTPVGPPTAANPTVRTLLYAAAVTGGWSGLLCLIVFLVGRILGVPFEMVLRGEPTDISWVAVLLLPLIAAVLGALLASLARGFPQGGRLVFWTGTLIAALSCLVPLGQPASVPWSTRILLLGMHLITWGLVVPQIARIVGDADPGRHVERA